MIPRQSLYTRPPVTMCCVDTRLLQPITGCISYTGLYVMTGGRYIDIVINVHSYQCRYFLCILYSHCTTYKCVGKSVRWASELGSVTHFSTISNSRIAMTNNVQPGVLVNARFINKDLVQVPVLINVTHISLVYITVKEYIRSLRLSLNMSLHWIKAISIR